jgi:hypothetical protein
LAQLQGWLAWRLARKLVWQWVLYFSRVACRSNQS